MVASSTNWLRQAAISGAALALLSGAPALAQGYGPGDQGAYDAGPSEEVIVTAPREHFREEGSGSRSLDFPPEKVSLSRAVHFGDLDLTTWDGAARLRTRVVRTARRVCGELRDAYPFEQLSTGTRCYREAVQNALLRSDEAISTARQNALYDYGYDN